LSVLGLDGDQLGCARLLLYQYLLSARLQGAIEQFESKLDHIKDGSEL
jgi:hypothetical protein